MSMLGTLAKVAIGVAIAKGANSVLKGMQGNQPQANQPRAGSPGGGTVFGDVFSPKPQSAGTGLEDMLGDALSGGVRSRTDDQTGRNPSAPSGGGLGGLLESLAQGSAGGAQTGQGGLDDLLQGQGGLGELLGGLLGGAAQGNTPRRTTAAKPGGAFGDLLNEALAGRQEPRTRPTEAQDAAAAIMLRAMIMAAKADGKIDEKERQKLIGNLGDVSPQERDFVTAELQAPIDPEGLIRQVPRGLEQQVYAMSVMAIDLDSRTEAQYLDSLAKGLGIDARTSNAIHAQLGVPALYR